MSKKEWLAGMRAIYPVCFGYIPMGLACGFLLQQAGYHWLAVMLMSLLIYGGASQFMIASMTVAGAGLLEMVIMIFFINLRHLLMSSSLAHRIREKSTAFSIFFAQTITDESFAVNTLYFRTE
ncbi:MAG TPA: AzlC family ABC transporter permease, partial [Trichococcus flocculiformis]|nr:AzlC family ABC transporter permease [Trichococcus flocculiformis]